MIVVSDPLASEGDGYWRHIKGFDKVAAPKELIDSCIAAKNPLVADYRAAANELWLLIINDLWRGPGEVYVAPDDLARWSFKFAFDRVLLFSREIGDNNSSVIDLRRS